MTTTIKKADTGFLPSEQTINPNEETLRQALADHATATRTFNIYQNDLRSVRAELNRLGWEEAAEKFSKVRTHLAMSFDGTEAWLPKMSRDYELVAKIQAENLEDVFRISNLHNQEESVTRFAPMHSLSVGDVVEDVEAGRFYLCADCGFDRILFLKAEAGAPTLTDDLMEILVTDDSDDGGVVQDQEPPQSLSVTPIQNGSELTGWGQLRPSQVQEKVSEMVDDYRRMGFRVFVNDHSGIDWTAEREPF